MSCEGSDMLDDRVQVKAEGSSNSKVCSVCGDSALGYNFNALTCESCKAFFRRNALKDKEFMCPFTESCVMTAITRRFCQRCRLQKCFAVGMRKEYIMSEEERLNKRQKIEQNRARKRATVNEGDVSKTNSLKKSRSSSVLSLPCSEWNTTSSDWSSNQLPENVDSPIATRSQESSPSQVPDSMSDGLLQSFPSPASASSAGCVLSPNSPPDSATVAASQNTEMVAKRDSRSQSQQSMISVITYPHNFSQAPETCSKQSNNSNSSLETKLPSVSVSTQTDYSSCESVATQTVDNLQPASQSTSPLLSSLVCNPHSNESTHQEVSTSPPPLTDQTTLSGGWVGVNGVNSCNVAWGPCASSISIPEINIDKDVLQDVKRVSGFSNSLDKFLSEAIKLEFSTYTPRALSVSPVYVNTPPLSNELSDGERAKLNELIIANKAMLAPLDEPTFSNNLIDIINLTAVAIRRLVKMAKKISAFKNMCQVDQVALLKGACMEMLILHSVTRYNPDKDSWAIPHNNAISVNVLKECKGNLYHEHRRFQQSFEPKWRSDENIMLILSAILLFTPARANVVHQDVIKHEQNSYYYLLRRYLACTLPGCEAQSSFFKLIEKISELYRLNEEHVRAYLDVDPCDVEPLLIEIFDLKPATVIKQ